jgi:O-antigen/teichoic acid export membrane protein
MSSSSYRTILRASSIIGAASVINILAGLVKMKVAAVLLGPVGVGLIGLYQTLMQTAGSVAGLGVTNSGTRQIAAAGVVGGAASVGRVRHALFWGTMTQAIVGAGLFWLASNWIAAHLVADPARANEVGWLALGVGLSIAAGAQSALLRGLRKVGDIAKIQAGSGVLGAVIGVAALWVWGAEGLVAMIVVAPVVSFALGHLYVARLPHPGGLSESALVLAKEWGAMLRLGAAFMISGLVTVLGFLAARVLIQRELGPDALGQFQAAWSIGMTYLGFVLGAMGSDYYPRLTAAMTAPESAVRLVNEQTEVALLLCGPVLVAMLGCAPWVIRLLYTADFGPAIEILRWQLLGDIFKVISWPLGFVLVAGGGGKSYTLIQSFGIGVFVMSVAVGLPLIGITATGVAFLLLYVAILPLVIWLARRKIPFRWARAVQWQAALVIGAALIVEVAARWSDFAGAGAGLGLGFLLGVWALMRLSAASGATGRLALLGRMGERIKRWITTHT